MKRNRLLPSALSRSKMKEYIINCSIRDKFIIQHQIHIIRNFWYRETNIESIIEIFSKVPQLHEFVDFGILSRRISEYEQSRNSSKSETSWSIETAFPEIMDVERAFTKGIEEVPGGIDKAEAWLYPIALDAGADIDVEAAVYFASRGQSVLKPEDIQERWLKAIRYAIATNSLMVFIEKRIMNKARTNVLTLTEAADVLKNQTGLLRFFSYYDNEDDLVEICLIRAIEWLGISGYDLWIEAYKKEYLSTITHGGVDPVNTAWSLFYICRSELAMQKIGKAAMEMLLFSISLGEVNYESPWRVFGKNNSIYIDYLPIASIIAFTWSRIIPVNITPDIKERAIDFVLKNQNEVSGAWPLVSGDKKGDIISTCAAIFALVATKPAGWKVRVDRAAKWLMSKQDPYGCWPTNGTPLVFGTVISIEALLLANGESLYTTSTSTTDYKAPQSVMLGENIEDKKPTIFLSYCHQDANIADIVESEIKKNVQGNIHIRRDSKELYYKSSIKEYMNSIRKDDYILMIISDGFLKSPKCMYEVLEALKDTGFKEKVLQIIITKDDRELYPDKSKSVEADIVSTEGRLKYIKYWKDKEESLNKQLREIDDISRTARIAEELKRISTISLEVELFLEDMSDLIFIPLQRLLKSNFIELIEKIR